MDNITITLTDAEMARARAHATAVEAASKRNGWRHKFTTPGEEPIDWQTRGYAAEMAAAKYLNEEWTGWVGTKTTSFKNKRGDVAGIEVRNSKRPDGWLYVYENDPEYRPVLLVTGIGPTFTLAGWIYAGEVKATGHMNVTDSGKASWCVKQDRLLPASTVPKEA